MMGNDIQRDNRYSWEEDLRQRIKLDFGIERDEVKNFIRRYIPGVTDEDMDRWEKARQLEAMVVDGEKRYFRKAAPNLFLINPECRRIKETVDGPIVEGYEEVDRDNVPAIIDEVRKTGNRMAQPKTIHVDYTLTVEPDAVPDGETIRCWLPYPRRDVERQQDVRLLATSESEFVISPADSPHSTLYMEKKAVSGQPAVFRETFEYRSFGCWFEPQVEDMKPYDVTSPLYQEYTKERSPHLLFSPVLRDLAEKLTEGVSHPLRKAGKIFKWIDAHFPWASSREYSTLGNIPEYVLRNRHGDCGQVTLLFLALCRICGIPSHFQSGFMMHPGHVNMHDWGEIYFEGPGWVPVDMSFGTPSYAKNSDERNFFLGGIDSYRWVVNSDYGCKLYPEKWYPRSETVDFQRGEVEWRGGNLYFDKWKKEIKAEY